MIFFNFIKGLVDNCPRCGLFADWDHRDRDMHKDHLSSCLDKVQHEKYRLKQLKDREKLALDLKKIQDQEDVTSKAVFDFLGADHNNLWLLTDKSLKEHCKLLNFECETLDRGSMIELLSAKNNSTTVLGKRDHAALTSIGDSTAISLAAEKKKISINSLPNNLYNLTAAQLKSILTLNGFDVSGRLSKADMIKEIENSIYED